MSIMKSIDKTCRVFSVSVENTKLWYQFFHTSFFETFSKKNPASMQDAGRFYS